MLIIGTFRSTLAGAPSLVYDDPMNPQTPALALGTVQWGMPYGIANRSGRAPIDDVRRMLVLAAEAGLDTLDTARVYGEAETVIGDMTAGASEWRIVTKTDPGIYSDGDSAEAVFAATRRSLDESRAQLQKASLDTVLLHRPDHRWVAEGAAWRALREAREAGEIRAIGISATSPEAALEGLEDPDVQVMQVPSSVLDRRLVTLGFFDAARDRGVEVHIRSAFLQGVAFMNVEELPGHLSGLGPCLMEIDSWSGAREVTRAAVFLAYALSLPVSRVVIGCERAEQLEWNLAASAMAPRLQEDLDALVGSLPELGEEVLDPACWPSTG